MLPCVNLLVVLGTAVVARVIQPAQDPIISLKHAPTIPYNPTTIASSPLTAHYPPIPLSFSEDKFTSHESTPQNCAIFHPSATATNQSSAHPIPSAAFEHLPQLLLSRPGLLNMLSPSSSAPQSSSVEIINIAETLSAPALSGVFLGLVYRPSAHRKASIRGGALSREIPQRWPTRVDDRVMAVREGSHKDKSVTSCLEKGMQAIAARSQAEGTIELQRGSVRFLLYRMD